MRGMRHLLAMGPRNQRMNLCCLVMSKSRRRQELSIDERLERGRERLMSIDCCVKAGLAKLDRADEGNGARLGSRCERKVGMLIALSDKRTQVTACEAIFDNDLRPHVGIFVNVRCN